MKGDRKRIVLGLVTLIAIFLYSCTSGSSLATPTSAPVVETTPRATPTPTPAPADQFGINRQQVYEAFTNLNIGLLPLNRHTDEWVSTMLPNGNIMIDIIGPSDGIQAIETTFRLTAETAVLIDFVAETMLQIVLGNDWRNGQEWVVPEMEKLSQDRPKIQTRMGGIYLTLYYIPRIESVMFSVDTEMQ